MGFGAGVLPIATLQTLPFADGPAGVPWLVVAVATVWIAGSAVLAAVLRIAGRADRVQDDDVERVRAGRRPDVATLRTPAGSGSAVASGVADADHAREGQGPTRRFARTPPPDPLHEAGPAEPERLVALTAQVLGAASCELDEQPGVEAEPVADGPSATAPLLLRGRMHGSLTVRSADPARRFGAGDLVLLRAMAELVAAALAMPRPRRWPSDSVRAQLEALETTIRGRDDDERHRAALAVSLARMVAERLSPDDPRARGELVLAARLHDIGMLRVPRASLRRAAPLAPLDTRLVARHPAWGSDILAGVRGMQAVAAIVRFHQERFDGQGYPHRLAGERIPLASRAVAACAAWAAIVSGGPHAPARSPEQAVDELRRHTGTQFDPAVVEAVAAASPRVPVLRVPA